MCKQLSCVTTTFHNKVRWPPFGVETHCINIKQLRLIIMVDNSCELTILLATSGNKQRFVHIKNYNT